jgi:hypothetical protein
MAASLVLVGVLASAVAPARAQIPTVDAVVAEGSTVPSGAVVVTLVFDVEAQSGPLGEDASGYGSIDLLVSGSVVFHVEGPVNCLEVSGDRAVIGLRTDPALSNFPAAGVMIETRDNGPPGSDPPDLLNAIPVDDPSICAPLFVPPTIEVVSGDVSVSDANPPPINRSECKRGGWRTFGFENQGACVAFVERGPRPEPGGSRE